MSSSETDNVEKPETTPPVVSVCVQTYKHCNYIQQCLESILAQETSFEFEVLVGEDDSQDGTREICVEFANRYPNKINLTLLDRKNVIYIDGNPTGRFNLLNNLSLARGKYIAFCEGDDYWNSPRKLEKQVAWLQSHSDYSMVVHDTCIANGNDVTTETWRNYGERTDFDLAFCISPLCPFHFSSLLMRKTAIDDLPEFFNQMPSADFLLQLIAARHGKVRRIPEIMSVYRKHAGGLSNAPTFAANMRYQKNFIRMLKAFSGIVSAKDAKHCRSLINQISYSMTREVLRTKSPYKEKISQLKDLSTVAALKGLLQRLQGKVISWNSKLANHTDFDIPVMPEECVQ